MQRRPTVGPGSQWTHFRECIPGAISKLGKGATLQRGQTWEWEEVSGGVTGPGGSDNVKARVCGSGDDKGNGSGRGRDDRGRGRGRLSGRGSGVCGRRVRGSGSGLCRGSGMSSCRGRRVARDRCGGSGSGRVRSGSGGRVGQW